MATEPIAGDAPGVDAIQQGHIGFEAAQLLARIATPDTEQAWVDRATRRTFKHLREEIQALERSIPSGELLRNNSGSHAEEPTGDHANRRQEATADRPDQHPGDEATIVQISGSPGGKVTLRIRVPGDLTSPCAFCHLQGEHGGCLKILPPGSNPTWLLGRRPIMQVHRRERTLLA